VHALLANVAAFGASDAAAARAANSAGLAAIGAPAPGTAPSFEPPENERNLGKLDAALRSLAVLRPNDRQRVLRGVQAAIRADRVVAVEEAELFRAIAAALDCPLPPGFSL
jgi:hypothetical protein